MIKFLYLPLNDLLAYIHPSTTPPPRSTGDSYGPVLGAHYRRRVSPLRGEGRHRQPRPQVHELRTKA